MPNCGKFSSMINLTVVDSIEAFLTASNLKYHVNYAIESSPFGSVLVATIDKFVCLLKFLNQIPLDGGAEIISTHFLNGVCREVSDVKKVIDVSKLDSMKCDIDLLVEGTPFQKAVWNELLTVPAGTTCFYSEVAERIGKPSAVRAVASAVGRNPIGYFVPCHRVVGKNGNFLKFASGPEIKGRLLKNEGVYI